MYGKLKYMIQMQQYKYIYTHTNTKKEQIYLNTTWFVMGAYLQQGE